MFGSQSTAAAFAFADPADPNVCSDNPAFLYWVFFVNIAYDIDKYQLHTLAKNLYA